ncbi:FAD-dependent oxidoreductase [Chitinophaga barathri]|uniref:FAD-dependent oxidoreductase n=1 Tax=Chitinophaga barathri TaxID=1647451 RepID=A0A3N4MS84_9BACT|nr:FAD-dependent oxidoreductase [Chitinophaga barathri]RPD43000.1 FAD-dependent oxidoreductase [Chitinophaga barathri]
MIKETFIKERHTKEEVLSADFVIVGGGLSGTCAAITAARAGISVILIQDRPVLGGNASSEVRLWVLGATSHMGNNNRWAREGGVIDEILVENTFRNPEGNTVLLDTIILEKVVSEPNIRLLLNTSVYEVSKHDGDRIREVKGFCSQNSTTYIVRSSWFCDASGDGILAFLSGAAFRMGAEAEAEFGEKFAPTKDYGELLGHTIYFYSKDTGRPVKFVPPSYALSDITEIPRYKSFKADDSGCKLWWIEYGGRLDTVHQTEVIKWELWKVVYGVWNYIKNSGSFPEAGNLTLEWVGNIPGKRESRRFEGEYILRQQDIIEQRTFDDAVAFGGWSIDLHPADGIFSEKPGCNQWHSKGIYQIPFRCYYSKNIPNLFFAGRIISASHVAFGSTRVMGTGAHGGQAVGMAAALAVKHNWSQSDLTSTQNIRLLQQTLLKTGHHIPGLRFSDSDNLVNHAKISASSELILRELPFDGPWIDLVFSSGQMLPAAPGKLPSVTFMVNAKEATTLDVELRVSSNPGNHTPDTLIEKRTINLLEGEQPLLLDFSYEVDQHRCVFLCLMKNANVSVKSSSQLVPGILTVFNKVNRAVSNYGKQSPPEDIGVEEFEFWCPNRRPQGQNFGLTMERALELFSANNVNNGIFRPTISPNAWVAAKHDQHPKLTIEWSSIQTISEIIIAFDTDYDHPMESSLMGHPEAVMPYCVNHYNICDDQGRVVHEVKDNHQTINKISFKTPLSTAKLVIRAYHPSENVQASIFEVVIS